MFLVKSFIVYTATTKKHKKIKKRKKRERKKKKGEKKKRGQKEKSRWHECI